jgi:group I intron endonuclease
MNENNCGIYGIYNTVTDKYYIGQSVNIKKRWNKHVSSLSRNSHYNIKLQRSWNNYGSSAFILLILEVCKSEVLTSREQHYIDLHLAVSNGYNLLEKADNSIGWWKNKRRSDSTKQKLSLINLGKTHSEATKLKIKLTCISKNLRPIQTRAGQVNTTEQNVKISSSITELWKDPQYRQKISFANSGEKSNFARLTEPDVLSILSSTDSEYDLALRYSVSKRHIKNIKNGKSWAYLQLNNRPS